MYAIVDGVEDVVMSIGSEKRKKLASKRGIEITELNKILYDKSLAKAPPNKTKEEIRAIDAAKAKKDETLKTVEEDREYRKIAALLGKVNGNPGNFLVSRNHDGLKTIASSMASNKGIVKGSSIGEVQVLKINKPSKKHPWGSASVMIDYGEGFGARGGKQRIVVDLPNLADQVRAYNQGKRNYMP